MQKKLFLLTAAIIAVGSVTSCGTKKADITPLTFGKLYDSNLSVEDNFEEINVSELRSLVEKKCNFALIVYDRTSTCTCWVAFKETIKTYMKSTNCLFYGLDVYDYQSSSNTFGLEISSGNETIAIFRDGEVKAQHNTADSNDKFTSDYQTFKDWMDDNAKVSDMLYITENQMEKLFEGHDPFTLGFLRKTCSDCSYLNEHILKEYNSKERNLSYVLECDKKGIRLGDDGKVDQTTWNSFKDKMGLSEAANPEYGYGIGYVPSFVRYNPDGSTNYASCIFDASVYLNDIVEKNGQEYIITDSFYSHDRLSNVAYLENVSDSVLIGKKYDSRDVIETDNGIIVKTEAAAKYHDPLFKSFLDFYIGM